MELFSHIILGVFLVMVINSATKYPLEKLTMYKNCDITNGPGWFVVLFAFFGIFMLPFYKPIKQFRKIYYIKNKIRMYEFWCLSYGIAPPDLNNNMDTWLPTSLIGESDKYHDEYLNNKRYLKLIRIQRKSKRYVNKFWKY
jgi:hypothetical protein